MDVKYTRRILLLGSRDCGALDVVKDLTGSAPTLNDDGSAAGLTHEWRVETAYYRAAVPIWVDELTDVQSWKEEFLKEEAQEVVQAIGAWIYCFRVPKDGRVSQEAEDAMRAIQEVVEEHAGYGADVVTLAVAMSGGGKAEGKAGMEGEWEDACQEHGFEYVEYGAKGRNEYGEKVGFERLKEALEANDWAAGGDDDGEDLEDLSIGSDDGIDGFGREEAEMTAELFGMKAALTGGDEDDLFEPETAHAGSPEPQAGQVDDLDRMLGKLLAIKEQGAELPMQQRKRLAAQAVRDIMKQNADK